MISSVARSVVATVSLVVTLAGPAVADTHNEGDGRLATGSGSGGFVADAPARRAYWVSFGGWVLCDTALDKGAADEKITLTRVRYVTGRRQPLEIRAYLRTVTPHQVASHPSKPAGVYSPFVATVGRPPHFDQPYAASPRESPGRYTRAIAGTQVLRGCDQARNDAYADAQGRVPEHAWTSLVLAVKVGPSAGRVRRTLIDYTVGDVAHTLRTRWVVGGRGYR